MNQRTIIVLRGPDERNPEFFDNFCTRLAWAIERDGLGPIDMVIEGRSMHLAAPDIKARDTGSQVDALRP